MLTAEQRRLAANGRREARAILWTNRRRLLAGLALLLVSRSAGFVLPASSKYLLDEAGFAVVPFQAFGLQGENGWFRLSVGAVSIRDIEESLPRVEAALRKALA